jgi:hypothetical protein
MVGRCRTATASCSMRHEARHSQLDGANWYFHGDSIDFSPYTPHALQRSTYHFRLACTMYSALNATRSGLIISWK